MSVTATPKQLVHILNGYADLYKLELNIIRFTDDVPISGHDIHVYGGTSSKVERQKRHRSIVYIIHDYKKSLFAPWYATRTDGRLQTCFATDDETIMDHIVKLIRERNHESSLGNNFNSSADTDSVDKVYEQLESLPIHVNQVQRLQQVDDTTSMETDDRQHTTNEILKEGECISKNIMINTAQSKTGHAKNHICSSKNIVSHIPICLFQSTTRPATITRPDVRTSHSTIQNYASPNVTRHPSRYRRVRMLKDLEKKDCPLVQAGNGKKQREYPEIESDGNDVELYVRVRTVTENRLRHPCQTVAPENAHVDWTLMTNTNDERSCLKCSSDSFDPVTESVFLKITDVERKDSKKIVKVYLFNWKQYGPSLTGAVECKNRRLCRLEFQLCIKISSSQYQLVSLPSYTSVIEQKDRDITIDPTKINPKELCELGGENITVPLSVTCHKRDFRIECNDIELKNKDFKIELKKLSIISPVKPEGMNSLHLVITTTDFVEDSLLRNENHLFDDYLPYVAHVDQNQNQAAQRLESPTEDLSHISVDNTSSSENHSTSFDLQHVALSEASAFIEQMLQEINQLKNNCRSLLDGISVQHQLSGIRSKFTNLNSISPQYSFELIQQRLMFISQIVQGAAEHIPQNNDTPIASNITVTNNDQQDNTSEIYKFNAFSATYCISLVQLGDTNYVVQTDQNSTDTSSFVLNRLSSATENFPTTSTSTLLSDKCKAPKILNQPKNKWHYRNMKDLGKKQIPLLAGDGPQRTLIRVKVPPKRTDSMYLGIKVQTYNNHDHRSKVPVPEGTTVNMDLFSNDNNLNRLQFDQCDSADYFDPVHRYVYSKISLTEHDAKEKDVRIHIFNLYQSGSINRARIDNEQLGKFKLAFWFNILKNNVFTPISPSSLSCKEPDYRIHGDVITIILKMDEEFTKILQNADAHSQDYVERLKDELRVCSIIDRLKVYLESKANNNVMISADFENGSILLVQPQHLCTAYMCVIEHLYYKYDKAPGQPSVPMMDRLCKYIYAKDTLNRARARASLCHVYHFALHDHYYEARDLMLMCHMQDTITTSDVATQILYNRTIVQLGLCAFRFGAIREAHQALVDMQSGNRAKELLAQGVQMIRNQERTRDQEMKERQRLLPFHMHINLELIECVYLVSAMLIEIPFMASHEYDARKRPISKHFHTQMRQAEKQPVFGPPESMREHVVAASRAMKTGDWSACVNFLINEKMNGKVWNLMPQATEVRKMLVDKIKEESLRTYLFTYATVYDAISMSTLADMFELPVKQVYGIISKMIINEELMASLEEPSQTVVMHHTDPSRTQALSLQLVEKIFQLYEQNEKLVHFRNGEPSFYSRPNQQVQQGQQRSQGTGGGGGSGQNWNRNQRSGPNRAY
ncbi:unnamed protein product [Rotaria sp. Silwood2]|nr:unnamed protein product [Rotaria sp. Silwood2]